MRKTIVPISWYLHHRSQAWVHLSGPGWHQGSRSHHSPCFDYPSPAGEMTNSNHCIHLGANQNLPSSNLCSLGRSMGLSTDPGRSIAHLPEPPRSVQKHWSRGPPEHLRRPLEGGQRLRFCPLPQEGPWSLHAAMSRRHAIHVQVRCRGIDPLWCLVR